ncbi:MAG TPA: hypothetical protein VKA60_27055 [Blastocatellia bacterium]|nr:hypothetical protein [Blastocatellia bacterium]
MNPIWTHAITSAVRRATKLCTHCKKASRYQLKQRGQYYKCQHCGHRFKEKGEPIRPR